MEEQPRSPEEHSTIIGGSTAKRLINCPGSHAMLAQLPPEPDEGSEASRRGTALHEVMAWWLDQEQRPDIRTAEGMTFCEGTPAERVITRDDVVDALMPAAEAFEHFAHLCGFEGGLEFDIEKRVEMVGVPGAFGTTDLVGRTQRRSVVWDWKFGFNAVSAVGNEQGLYYATAAMLTKDTADLFEMDDDDWPVEVIICQPAAYENGQLCYERWTTTVGNLKAFRGKVLSAVAEAQSENPRTNRGDWCQFQRCRAICPLHRAPLARMAEATSQLAQLEEQHGKQQLVALPQDQDGIADVLGRILDYKELIKPVIDAAEALAHQRLEAGQPVTGYKLVPKRASRKGWTDIKKATGLLRRAGLKTKDFLTTPEVVSPAQAEKVLKAHGIKLDEKQQKLFAELSPSTSSGSTIAPWDDKRKEIANPTLALSELAQKLAAE